MIRPTIQFGWRAPSFAEQLPALLPADADRADAIGKAIILLSVHGIITEAERDRAIKRATSRIERDLAQAIEAEGQDDEVGLVHESAVGESRGARE